VAVAVEVAVAVVLATSGLTQPKGSASTAMESAVPSRMCWGCRRVVGETRSGRNGTVRQSDRFQSAGSCGRLPGAAEVPYFRQGHAVVEAWGLRARRRQTGLRMTRTAAAT
jgi:hypothetical protein